MFKKNQIDPSSQQKVDSDKKINTDSQKAIVDFHSKLLKICEFYVNPSPCWITASKPSFKNALLILVLNAQEGRNLRPLDH